MYPNLSCYSLPRICRIAARMGGIAAQAALWWYLAYGRGVAAIPLDRINYYMINSEKLDEYVIALHLQS